MAQKCELCGKIPHYGNVISHANNTRRRRWNPNLKRVRAVVEGATKRIRVCASCIRSGRVRKAVPTGRQAA
jgi:large subunit ribosomal protein L28